MVISSPCLIFSSCIIYDTCEVCACTGANRIQSMKTCHPAYTGSNRLYILLHFLSSWNYLILFSFHLSVSFIISPFVFFFHCFPSALVSVVALCFVYLSLSLRISDLCKILSPPWFQVLNGYGLMRGVAGVRDRRNAVYWGKAFSKSQKRLEKRAKAECTKHAMYVLQQDLRGDILIDWAQTLWPEVKLLFGNLQLLNQNFKQAPFVLCPLCTDKW